jgi:hypothetical protein
MSVVDIPFNQPLKIEERATMPLAGGLMQNGYQCGMLWGAALAAGAQAYRLLGSGPQAESEAITASQKLVESFRARNKEINCAELTSMNWKSSSQSQAVTQVLKFFLKGGPIGCFSMAARYAPVAFSDIKSAISESPVEAPSHPVSCAAMLARKIGVSDMHAVMAAGFAGGIGLSGGGCGALGAAIWIGGMKHIKDGDKDFAFNSPLTQAAIERFLESTDYEFECSKIVGRKFENAADHAGYICAGGCSKIIEALATQKL